MAPPKVSVTKKQPLKDVGALEQKVGSKASVFAACNNAVDPNFPQCKQKTACQRGRYRKSILIGVAVAFLIIIVVVICIPVIFFLTNRRPGEKPPGPGDVFQMGLSSSDDIQYDDNKQRINVTMSGRPRAVLAWADYSKQVAVFLDDVNKQCYVVSPLQENYMNAKPRWQSFQGFMPFPRCPPLQVQGPADPATLDPEAAQYCKDYLVFQASFQLRPNPPQAGEPMGDGHMGDGHMEDEHMEDEHMTG